MSMRATPSTRCSRLPTTWSPRIDSSRGLRVFDSSASSTTGWVLSLFQRATVGALASFGKTRLHRRDAVAHVLHRAPHVGVEAELDAGLAAALEAARGDALDAGDAVDAPPRAAW